MPEDYESKTHLLRCSLELAVPLWQGELQGVPFDDLVRMAKECSQVVAEKGDIILYRSQKKGETAKAFNSLAKGLAILSFAPGGVKFLGMHFKAKSFQEQGTQFHFQHEVEAMRKQSDEERRFGEIVAVIEAVKSDAEVPLAFQRIREIVTAEAPLTLDAPDVNELLAEATEEPAAIEASILPENEGRRYNHPADAYPRTGTLCSVCGKPQHATPSGDTCVNGHGGAPPMEEPVDAG